MATYGRRVARPLLAVGLRSNKTNVPCGFHSYCEEKRCQGQRCQERMALLLGVIGVMAIRCFFLNEVSGE